MGLFLRQNDQRSELQSKVAADLQQKLRATSLNEGEPVQTESRFLENQHETRPAGIVIGLLLVVFVGLVIWIIAANQ